MHIIRNFRERRQRVKYGIDTKTDIFWEYVDRLCHRLFRVKTDFHYKSQNPRLRAEHWHEEDKSYHFGGMKFPEMEYEYDRKIGGIISQYYSYLHLDDKYDEATVEFCRKMFSEYGEEPYGLVNDRVNVTVSPGDIVVDAGSWIGDFAAYASAKGATVYAFEPTLRTFRILQRTAELNGNIHPVNKGLSDEASSVPLYLNTTGNTGANSFMNPKEKSFEGFLLSAKEYGGVQAEASTVRLDDFVRDNGIPRVDFIKCDIEGFERHMLAGAQETLARFAPKLALCTYHLPDDPQVMAALIKQANPRYNIVQKSKKLFASVPE